MKFLVSYFFHKHISLIKVKNNNLNVVETARCRDCELVCQASGFSPEKKDLVLLLFHRLAQLKFFF